METDVLLGRMLAVCCHPQAAWRVLPKRGRLALAAAYFAVAYFGVLTALITILSRS
jgi:hypothetical protein